MNKLDTHERRYPVLFYTTLRFNDTPLLASSLDAGVRGHPGVKEHTDHKHRNALPVGLADELASLRIIKDNIYTCFYLLYIAV